MRRRTSMAALAASAAWPLVARPADGVTDKEVLVGQSGIVSGPLGTTIKTMLTGVNAAFAGVNASGGVAGRSIRLISLDDELVPAKAVANYKRLLETERVFALTACVGSGTTAAAAEVLHAHDAVMVGGYAVTDSARDKAAGSAFFVRATAQRECEALVRHLMTVNMERVAVAHLDNPGGQEAQRLVDAELAQSKLKSVVAAAIRFDGSNVEAAAQAIAAQSPQAVIMYLSGRLPADLMRALRKVGSFPSFYGMSIVSGEVAAKILGEQVRGLAVAQVMPFPWWKGSAELAAYQQALAALPGGVNYYSIEGWIAAQLLIEGLRRCGRDLTRPRFAAALHGLKTHIAGLDLDFTGGRQTGSRFVELVQVRADGSFVR